MAFTERDRRFEVASHGRRYLADAGELAVYLALVGEPGKVWRAEALAARLDLQVDIVRKVLSAFEVAGIVQSGIERGDRGFAWRSDVRYVLDDREEVELPVDPVCQMSVVKDSPYRARDPRGHEYVFCCSKCLETFRTLMNHPDGAARLSRVREMRRMGSRPAETAS